jgi:DNA-binding MarR family transcriptional regulator
MLPIWKYSRMEEYMETSQQMTDQFVQILQRFMRLRPKLVLPDRHVRHVSNLREQLQNLKNTAAGNPEDRMFLFRILDILSHSETPPTMGELSTELEIPLSSATRMANGLVRANFVERSTDRNDRRVVRLCLTENGRQFIHIAMEHMKEHIALLLKHLSLEEQAQLLRLMNKVLDSIQAEKTKERTDETL